MAGTPARYSLTHGMPAARIGWLVAEARSAAGLTPEDLAEHAGVRLRAVKRWEKGAQIPSDDEVLAVARACGIGVGNLLPPRDTVEFDRTARSLRVGGSVVSVTDVHNEAVLTTYVQLVRQQRGLPAGAAFEIRHEDVDALADTLDLDDAELEARLVAIVGLPAEAAAGIRQRLLSRRRLGLPAGIVVTSLGLMPGAGGTDAQAAVVPPVAAVVAAPAPASALGATIGASAPASSEPAVWTTAQAPQAPQAPEDGPAAVAAAATPADIAPPTPAPERAMVAVTTPAIEIGEAVQIHNPQSPAAG